MHHGNIRPCNAKGTHRQSPPDKGSIHNSLHQTKGPSIRHGQALSKKRATAPARRTQTKAAVATPGACSSAGGPQSQSNLKAKPAPAK